MEITQRKPILELRTEKEGRGEKIIEIDFNTFNKENRIYLCRGFLTEKELRRFPEMLYNFIELYDKTKAGLND